MDYEETKWIGDRIRGQATETLQCGSNLLVKVAKSGDDHFQCMFTPMT